jgi:hypothetical protein
MALIQHATVGRSATRSRTIALGRIQAPGEIVNRSSADGVLARDNRTIDFGLKNGFQLVASFVAAAGLQGSQSTPQGSRGVKGSRARRKGQGDDRPSGS